MKAYCESGGIAPRIFIWALDEGEWSASRPARFTPRERAPDTHWIAGWVSTRAGLDTVVKRKIPSPCRDLNPRSSNSIVSYTCTRVYPKVSGLSRTTINTRWEAIQRVMAAKLSRLTHKIAIQLHLVAESCTICSSRSRRPVRKLLDTPSYSSKHY
jgi:hypothetical protein